MKLGIPHPPKNLLEHAAQASDWLELYLTKRIKRVQRRPRRERPIKWRGRGQDSESLALDENDAISSQGSASHA
jgi:hypothetical protein